LAALWVEDTLRTPLSRLVAPAWLANQLVTGLRAATASGAARDAALRQWQAFRDRAGDRRGALRGELDVEVVTAVRKMALRKYVPSEDLVLRLLDQPSLRGLVHEVLESTVKGFRERALKVDDTVLGGFGRRAARRGAGLFGGLAEDLVGAVADEVEAKVERRVRDFLDQATGEALRTVARHLANPKNADMHANARVGMIDAVLDTPVRDLLREADAADPEAVVDLIVEVLRDAAASEDLVARVTERLEALSAEIGEGTLEGWLRDVDLLETWRDSTVEFLATRVASTARTPEFRAYWEQLHA
jgi:hypothetical protein